MIWINFETHQIKSAADTAANLDRYGVREPYAKREQFRQSKYEAKAIASKILTKKTKHDPPGLWASFRKFKERGVFDIIGKKVATDKMGNITPYGYMQLTTALQIYRNKKFETFRYIFIDKTGSIRDQIAVSSHLPSCTITRPNVMQGGKNIFFEQCREYAQSTHTKIVLAHNHPSGNITPSHNDINTTVFLHTTFSDAFAGHIILDHGTYNLYHPQTAVWMCSELVEEIGHDPLLKTRNKYAPVVMNSYSDFKQLNTIAQSIDAQAQWNTKDWIPLFYINATARITTLEYIRMNVLKKRLLNTAMQNGGIAVFAIANDCWTALSQTLQECFHKKLFTDVLINGKVYIKKKVLESTISDFVSPHNPISGRLYAAEKVKQSAAIYGDSRFLTFAQIDTLALKLKIFSCRMKTVVLADL